MMKSTVLPAIETLLQLGGSHSRIYQILVPTVFKCAENVQGHTQSKQKSMEVLALCPLPFSQGNF